MMNVILSILTESLSYAHLNHKNTRNKYEKSGVPTFIVLDK